MEQYIEKLEEYVKDEDTVVTFPSLANSLNVSIQKSQQILEKYVELYEKSNSIHVSYVITGSLKNGQGIAVYLVKQSELEQKRSLFENDLHCCVYSIQKSPILDFNVLSLVDKVSEGKTRDKALAGCVISKNCVKRTLKFKKLPAPPPPTLKGKSSFFTKQSSGSSEKVTQENNGKPKQQSGIAAMFSKAASSSSLKKSVEKTSNNSKPKPNGKISGFFTKSINSSGSFNKTSSVKSGDSIKTEEIIDELMDVDVSEDFDDKDSKIMSEPSKTEEEPVKSKPKTENKVFKEETPKKNGNIGKKGVGKGERKKKRNRSRSEEKNTKKRKRIIVRDDSDSDDIFKSEESEGVVESSDEEPPEKAPAVTVKKPLAPKNKKRVAIDKTYVDEEGFVVTKVEYEYVSASDEESVAKESVKIEDNPKPKVLEKKNSSNSENDENPVKSMSKGRKGKKPTASGNQPTLMNFFKKK